MSFAFFDLDDTLVDMQTALRAWAHDFVAEYGLADVTAADVVSHRARDVGTWLEFDELTTSYTAKFTLSPTVADGLTRLREAGWMVGDILDKDVEGGIAAGLRTIWLPHGVVRDLADPKPEFTATSIDEAVAIIEGSAE